MNKRNKILIGAGIVLLAGVIGTGIYMQQRGKGEDKSTELAYVTSVSSMDPSSQVQRLAGVVEPQKTWEIQKNAEREVKEILVEVGSEVEVGTALFVYDTETLEADRSRPSWIWSGQTPIWRTCAVRSHSWKKKRNPPQRMTSFPTRPRSRQHRWT
ncbi:efflux RND transporter periplasmic adaptor subunit [Blautia sp. RD014234]|nr:efflux RND transporter periplasmic adaptor subunit [Blautia parvula]